MSIFRQIVLEFLDLFIKIWLNIAKHDYNFVPSISKFLWIEHIA